MANLLNKLNVLVKSGMHGVLRDEPGSRRRGRTSQRGRDAAALRDQVNKALDDEDRMTAEIAALQQEIASWDQQADRALANGDEAAARHAVRQMQLQQKRAAFLESDLAEHRASTSELISRVNTLEAAAAEADRQEKTASSPDDHAAATGEALADRLRRIRQQVTERGPAAAPDVEEPDIDIVDTQAIDDDLAQRRARLSL
jgi:phage shock protein A